MSHSALAEQPSATDDLKWIVLDGDPDVAATYGSILEMRTSPIRLSGVKAARFAAAKQVRVLPAARPLPLE